MRRQDAEFIGKTLAMAVVWGLYGLAAFLTWAVATLAGAYSP